MDISQVDPNRKSAATTVHRTPSSFRFLDLPAEIRNMIYTLCTDSVSPDDYTKLRITPHSLASYPRTLHFRLKFYALTFASRQLRAEFRGMYMLATPTWVSYRCALRYLYDFHGAATRVVDDVTFDLFDLCLRSTPKDQDLLPLLRQLSRYSGLRVRFRAKQVGRMGRSLMGLGALMDACVGKMHTPEWQRLVSGEVAKIVPKKRTKKLWVYVRPGTASWRKRDERTGFEAQVLGNMGLDGGLGWTAIVKYEKRVPYVASP